MLSNPENRKKYDDYGKDWKHADEFEKIKQQQYRNTLQDASSGFFESDYSSFFESMFGGGSSRVRGGNVKFKGQDYNSELKLDLKDVYTTHKRTLTVNGKKNQTYHTCCN
ncbi:hypothetical protein [Ancylomarina sp.]|uniref:hypothetical protein n=1 Tax=Ancylomarina sp. TaxID=1970196 RepID=UPI0035687F7D